MKTNSPLDDLLRSWNPETDAPADLHAKVWQRIAASADAVGNAPARPFRARVVALAAAAVVVAGFGLGLLTGQTNRPSARDIYFTRIDPITKAR